MKYAAAFAVDRNFEICGWYDYTRVYNDQSMPSWWDHHVEGFWEGDLYWCLVEWEDD